LPLFGYFLGFFCESTDAADVTVVNNDFLLCRFWLGVFVSAGSIICGVSSSLAPISPNTAVITGSAGKSSTSVLLGHTAAHYALQAIMAIPVIICFFI
jgi:UDP-N-acetylmuramoylalanine-D-glutamate ligase